MAEGWPSCQRAGKNKRQVDVIEDSDELDNSLTSLMWLQDFSIKNTSMGESSCCPSGPGPLDGPSIHSFAASCSPLAADPVCMDVPYTPCKPNSSSTSRATHQAMATHPQLAQDVDYKTNPHVKPPYSYATLICMAMEASGKPITLSAIYQWISNNFCYFQHADPTWQVGEVETLCLFSLPAGLGRAFHSLQRARQAPMGLLHPTGSRAAPAASGEGL